VISKKVQAKAPPDDDAALLADPLRIPTSLNQPRFAPLKSAFDVLSDAGYFTAMGFLCCQTCAWHAVPEDEADKAVFFHAQDADDLIETGECYLCWSGNVGFIRNVLEKHNIATTHNGSNTQRIKIMLPKLH
jgi:hypothetical protein